MFIELTKDMKRKSPIQQYPLPYQAILTNVDYFPFRLSAFFFLCISFWQISSQTPQFPNDFFLLLAVVELALPLLLLSESLAAWLYKLHRNSKQNQHVLYRMLFRFFSSYTHNRLSIFSYKIQRLYIGQCDIDWCNDDRMGTGNIKMKN